MDERLQSPEVSNQLISLTSREQRNFNIPTGGYKVSNQLISLTSRECTPASASANQALVSNQLISLTSREELILILLTTIRCGNVSNQLISLTSRESSHFKPIRHRLSRSGLRGSEISSAETTFYSLIKTLEPIPRGIARLPTTESALQRFYLSLAEKIK